MKQSIHPAIAEHVMEENERLRGLLFGILSTPRGSSGRIIIESDEEADIRSALSRHPETVRCPGTEDKATMRADGSQDAAQPAEAEGVEVQPVAWRYTSSQSFGRRDRRWHYQETFPEAGSRQVQEIGHLDALVRESDHLAALSAVTAERDRLQRNLNFTEQWYAERFERLADLGKSAGCWDAMAAIIANGTADPYEPPTYAQQLVRAKHRADVAERERDRLSAEVERLREDAERWNYVSLQGDDTHWLNLLRVDLEDFGGNINAAVDALIDGDTPAMAAKEA